MNDARNNFTTAPHCGHDVHDSHAFRVELSYFENFIGSNRSIKSLLTALHSALFLCVSHVVELSANKKMLRINASPIIAFMENAQGLVKIPFVENVRVSVWSGSLSLYKKVAVSVFSFCAKPIPALSKLRLVNRDWSVFIHFFQKPLLRIVSWSKFVSSHINSIKMPANHDGKSHRAGTMIDGHKFLESLLRPTFRAARFYIT